jgi:hypothetical protein
VPGTSFVRYRIVKFSVYGAAAPGSFVSIRDSETSASILGTDAFRFEDFGTQGSVRPAIHLQPNWLFRTTWYSLAATANTESYIIKTLPDSEIIIQYTLELESISPSTLP